MRLVKSLSAGIVAVAVTAFLLSIFTFCYVQLRLWIDRHWNPATHLGRGSLEPLLSGIISSLNRSVHRRSVLDAQKIAAMNLLLGSTCGICTVVLNLHPLTTWIWRTPRQNRQPSSGRGTV